MVLFANTGMHYEQCFLQQSSGEDGNKSAWRQAMSSWIEGELGEWFRVPYKGPSSVSVSCVVSQLFQKGFIGQTGQAVA